MAGAAMPAVAPASNLLRDNFIEISSLETTVAVDEALFRERCRSWRKRVKPPPAETVGGGRGPLNLATTLPMYIRLGYTGVVNGSVNRVYQQSKPGGAAAEGSGVSRGGASGGGYPARQRPIDHPGWAALG